MTLANGTTISGTTNGDGIFAAPDIPLGTFEASVSSFGSNAEIAGNSAVQSITPVSVLFSTLSLGLVAGAIIAAIAVAIGIVLLRRRKP